MTQIDEIYASDLPPAQKLRWALKNHAVVMMDHLDLVAVYLYEYPNLPPERLAEAIPWVHGNREKEQGECPPSSLEDAVR